MESLLLLFPPSPSLLFYFFFFFFFYSPFPSFPCFSSSPTKLTNGFSPPLSPLLLLRFLPAKSQFRRSFFLYFLWVSPISGWLTKKIKLAGFASKDGGPCPQLLDLISKERDEEKKLELRLGPPVVDEDEDWRIITFSGAKRVFSDIKEPATERINGGNLNQKSIQSPCPWKQQQQQTNPLFLQLQPNPKSDPVIENESSQPCSSIKAPQTNAFSPSPPNNSDQKRICSAPAVGWPPIRSFRKNLINNGGSSSKVGSCYEKSKNGLFVKINMEGVAIGRKVDLKAYDSYDKLSTVVDELFRGLLAAQTQKRDSSDGGGEKAITGLLDGSGEFTLVYEDNEGDTVLVGDVPWHMFVCSVRRLRVIKSSEIPRLCGRN